MRKWPSASQPPGGAALPNFPTKQKSLMGWMPKVISARRLLVGRYLNALLAVPGVVSAGPLDKFLRLSEHVAARAELGGAGRQAAAEERAREAARAVWYGMVWYGKSCIPTGRRVKALFIEPWTGWVPLLPAAHHKPGLPNTTQ